MIQYRYYYKDYFDPRNNRIVVSLDQLAGLTGKSKRVLEEIFKRTTHHEIIGRFYIEKVKFMGMDL